MPGTAPQPKRTNSDDQPEDDEPPDESTLLGKAGVEEEVLAELARAEAEMQGKAPADESDDRGAQV